MVQASVIVPVRDAARTLPRTLAALVAQDAPFDFEVLVVDDGSRDGSAELAERAGAAVRLVRTSARGPAAARNRGVAESSGQVLAFCDADCFPVPGWLGTGASALEQASLVQGRVLPDPGVRVGPFDRTLWITHEVGLWETANLFVTRDVFARAGGFVDWLRPVVGKAMAEDVWFGWRAKRLGVTSAFCSEALAYHAVFPRGPSDYVSERRRLRHFPEMTAKMPELRDAFLYRRWFLNRRTAAFDLACAGLTAAAITRRPWLAGATLPYANAVQRRARSFEHGAAGIAAVDVAADLVGAWSLAQGTIVSGAPVL